MREHIFAASASRLREVLAEQQQDDVSRPAWIGRRSWVSHPNLIDFSIMGYNGNLWQRLPQVTVSHKFTENFDGLITAMRFERGLSAIEPQTQRRPFDGGAVGGIPPAGCANGFACSENAFNDPVQMPYFGTRFGYNGTGNMARDHDRH